MLCYMFGIYAIVMKADVVLRGYSGYNTRWALKVIHKVFPAGGDAPLAVAVFFGANDASLPDRHSGFQHVPLDEYKHNLLAIVAFFKVKNQLHPAATPHVPIWKWGGSRKT